jgi:hypothetical protein
MAEFTHTVRKLDPHDATLTVLVDVSELRVRMAIGIWLIKLGARVIGLGVRVGPLEVGPAPEDCIEPVDAPVAPKPPAPPPDGREEHGG